MRNWHPFIADTLKQMTADGVEQAVAICLAPHNSRTSVGLYKQVLFGADAPFAIDFVEEWHDHPLLIEAFAEQLAHRLDKRLRAAWIAAAGDCSPRIACRSEPLPKAILTRAQTRETAALVAAQVPEIGAWQFAFQSQGMSGGEWLGPTVEDTINGLREAGQPACFSSPSASSAITSKFCSTSISCSGEFAEERGMKLYRAESLNDSPLFVRAVADLARTRLAAMSPVASGGIQG